MSSVRDYAILWVGAARGGTGRGGNALGGNALLTVPQHKIDGLEHLAGDEGETRLDATVDRHGLLPTLSGSTDEFLNGIGAYAVPAGAGAITPYYIPADETFTVPLYRQALFNEAIEVDGGLVVNGLLIGVD